MKIASILLLTIMMVCLVGCAHLRHKSFRAVSNAIGAKMTVADPSGSGNPAPMFMMGSITNVITTITPGTKLKSTTEIGSIVRDRPAFTDSLEVDSTGSGDFKTTKSGVDYRHLPIKK